MSKPKQWTVNHHLPGGRYGSISIRLNDEPVAKMWGDTPKMLRLAKRIVAAMNADDVWCVQSRDRWCATKDGRKPSADATCDPTACGMYVTLRWGSAKMRPTCEHCLAALGGSSKGGEKEANQS